MRWLWARTWVRRCLLVAMVVVPAAVAAMGWSWVAIRVSTSGRTYSTATVPAAPVGIVLGARVNDDGTPRSYLEERLRTAKALYDRGKIGVILVTGEDGSIEHDEVTVMRTWLARNGVPAAKVIADYAGFDTYDSCHRAATVFGVTKAIVVTQGFHLPRALFLCGRAGIDATGVESPAPDNDFRYQVREVPAALKAVVDGIFT